MNSTSAKFVASRIQRRLRAVAAATLATGLTLSIVTAEETPAAAPAADGAAANVWSGVFSPEQVVRGRRSYNSLCARCHGEALGGGEDSPTLVDKDFLKNWYGKTVGELVEYTRTEMPSDGPGKVTRKQSTDITTYVLATNGFPTGASELAPDPDKMNQIQITPKK